MKSNRGKKIAIVLGGYCLAIIGTAVAFAVRRKLPQPAEIQASAGMYAFGEAVLFTGLFLVLSLVPTALATYFIVKSFGKRRDNKPKD